MLPRCKAQGFPGYGQGRPASYRRRTQRPEGETLFVPLTVDDFLHRAETVFADTVALVDEPPSPPGRCPAPPTASSPGACGPGRPAWMHWVCGPGERVAVVSQNSARLLELLYAVPASGRIAVPVNFRLRADEVRYSVEHSGASVLLVDPELDEPLRDVRAPHRIVLGAESEALAMRFDVAPRPWTARTRTRPPRSTTRPGPRPGRKGSSSPTATSG